MKLALEFSRSAGELRRGMKEIEAERPELFGRRGLPVRFEARQDGAPGVEVTRAGKGFTVRYGRKVEAFRAVARILGGGADTEDGFVETPLFDMLGVMVDVSRNAVLNPEGARRMLRRCALMGFSTCMLYSEDTYEVPGEPFFGYLRGRYTQRELKSLDDYAAALGIEMVPCIQTLAHLEQILQWPAYAEYRDTERVMLADWEPTYALIEKLIAAASAPFRTKRIHVGLDEAQGIGTGRYAKLFGEANAFDILNRHLRRIKEICERRGLKPMIWSDMYFRIASKTHQYYDREAVIPAEVAEAIPEGVQLVYWDYYHTEQAFYEEYIDRHRALGREPLVAGGVWTWDNFWTDMRFTLEATEPCLMACKAKGVREVFATMWGDDANEYAPPSALPGMQYFAEHGYADKVDLETLARRYTGSTGGDFSAMARASGLSNLPGKSKGQPANPEKWLLWQDPLLSFLDPLVKGIAAEEHYRLLGEELSAAAKRKGNEPLAYAAQLARVLSIKCGLRAAMAKAYGRKDRKAVRALVKGDLATLRKGVRKLWQMHREMWMEHYKPFGWEVIEGRYGGLMARLETTAERATAWADGKIDTVPELEAKFLPVLEQKGRLPYIEHKRAKTPSTIK